MRPEFVVGAVLDDQRLMSVLDGGSVAEALREQRGEFLQHDLPESAAEQPTGGFIPETAVGLGERGDVLRSQRQHHAGIGIAAADPAHLL